MLLNLRNLKVNINNLLTFFGNRLIFNAKKKNEILYFNHSKKDIQKSMLLSTKQQRVKLIRGVIKHS